MEAFCSNFGRVDMRQTDPSFLHSAIGRASGLTRTTTEEGVHWISSLRICGSCVVGEKLIDNDKYSIEEILLNEYSLLMNLTIRNLERRDFGGYLCSSVNALGKVEGAVRLQGPPSDGSDNSVWPRGSLVVSGRPRIETRADSWLKAPLSLLCQLEGEELHLAPKTTILPSPAKPDVLKTSRKKPTSHVHDKKKKKKKLKKDDLDDNSEEEGMDDAGSDTVTTGSLVESRTMQTLLPSASRPPSWILHRNDVVNSSARARQLCLPVWGAIVATLVVAASLATRARC
uniref:Ig-like domain-containing protein n=1 Tax=Timema cristinae TaxID=61476 RepID=A0A7R9CHP2_TIMCR|nr:unnamed protein product [Timema cristinae]